MSSDPTVDVSNDPIADATPTSTAGPQALQDREAGENHELPDSATSTDTATLADEENETPYVPHLVPTTPEPSRPNTRLRAKKESLVYPEPITDIPSETEETSVTTPGRRVVRRTSTARA